MKMAGTDRGWECWHDKRGFSTGATRTRSIGRCSRAARYPFHLLPRGKLVTRSHQCRVAIKSHQARHIAGPTPSQFCGWLTYSAKRAGCPVGDVMRRSLKRQQWQKPARDFLCSLIAFVALFAAMSPGHEAAPAPVFSLIGSSTATAADYRPGPDVRRLNGAAHDPITKTFPGQTLSPINLPLISTILALVFSSIMAFNLALLRHLRRVNASSRRGAWKEG